MRAMILAAGRGERMRELTQNTPKPLLRLGNQYLIEYAIHNLKSAGIQDIVINVSYQADQIKQALGRGDRYGVRLYFSEEPQRLETGGGIFQALPLLGNEPFIVVSSDIVSDFPIANLFKRTHKLAHLVMVPNPAFHPQGDFALRTGLLHLSGEPRYTYGNIGVFHPELFADCKHGYFRLADVLIPAIGMEQISGECYEGAWHNIGTPEDLANLNNRTIAS